MSRNRSPTAAVPRHHETEQHETTTAATQRHASSSGHVDASGVGKHHADDEEESASPFLNGSSASSNRMAVLTWQFLPINVCITLMLYTIFSHAAAHSSMYGGPDGEYLRGLAKPWAPFSNGIDLSDAQWKEFRQYIPLISIGVIAFVSASRAVRMLATNLFPSSSSSSRATGDAADHGLSGGAHSVVMAYYAILNLIVVYFLHGNDLIFLIALALFNYLIVAVFGKGSLTIPLTWLFNCTALFWADRTDGFHELYDYFGVHDLRRNTGIISWDTYFKMTMLRHIAFNCDRVWAMRKRALQIDLTSGKQPALIVAQEVHRPISEYSFVNMIAYIWYGPLFIAGPIASFNAFSAQVKTPQTTYDFKTLLKMTLKLAGIIFLFELALHYFYYYAFNLYGYWRTKFSPMDVAITGFLTLNFMYTKFTIIWRVFRLWALFDGIDTQENMLRCVCNNHTFQGFWRSWHGSFNKWIVRYMYVPMGGKKYAFLSVWIIFTFVGLWHDLIWRWMAWAWLNCAGLIVEMGFTYFFSQHKATAFLRKKWWWGHARALAGGLNIFMLMAANLAILHGFAHTPVFLRRAFWGENGEGITVFFLAWILMYCGVSLMHEIRRLEGLLNESKRY